MTTDKDLCVLIIGCGSIGSRHARNLATLGVSSLILLDPNEERTKALADALPDLDIKRATVIEDAFNMSAEIDAAVIASPSSMHVDHATRCVTAGIDIFIEKPLSNTLDSLDFLSSEVKSRGTVVMMAMCYRFHPVFVRLKAIIDEGILGKIHHVNYFGGHYLPDWHPDSDYREEYAARAELGGGVLLTSIHGLDNLRYLFGEICEAAAFAEHVSELEMDVEDMVASIMKTEKGIYISMYSDFLNRVSQHKMVITASLGTLVCDFISGSIGLFSIDDRQWSEELVEFDINTMYRDEMAYFLSLLGSHGVDVSPDLIDGIKTLKLALALKDSSSQRKFVTL